jgi:hypothetical protein
MTAAVAQACRTPVMVVNDAPAVSGRLLPRSPAAVEHKVARGMSAEVAAVEYRRAVSSAVEDFVIDGDEVDELHRLVVALGLSADEIAEAHRAFLRDRLTLYLDDDELSWEEYEQLRVLARLLAIDGRWLEELVTDVRPRYVALTNARGRRRQPQRGPGRAGAAGATERLLHWSVRGDAADA